MIANFAPSFRTPRYIPYYLHSHLLSTSQINTYSFDSTSIVIFLQIVVLDQILRNRTNYHTKYPIFQYIYPLWKTFFSNYLILNWTYILVLIKMLPEPFMLSDQQRQIHKLFFYTRCNTIFT